MGIKLGLFQWILWNYLRCFMLSTARNMLFELKGACGTSWERRNVWIFVVGKAEERRLVGTLDVVGGMILKWTLEWCCRKAQTGFVYLSIGASGWLWFIGLWTLRINKM